MQRGIAQAQQGLAKLTLLGLLVQFYLAGVGAFGADTWDLHMTWGYIMGIPILLLLILALIGRLGRRRIGMTALAVVLFIVQVILAQIRTDAAYVAALHPVNALAIMGVVAATSRAMPEEHEMEMRSEPVSREV